MLQLGTAVLFLLLVGVFFRPLEKIATVIETYPRGIAGFLKVHSKINNIAPATYAAQFHSTVQQLAA